jgi:YfiH family protein
MHPGWSLTDRGGLRVAMCDVLEAVPGVGHLFSTRVGRTEGPPTTGDLARAAGLDPDGLPRIRQVHGVSLRRLRDEDRGDDGIVEADGAWALREEGRRRSPAVGTADCVPLLLAERGGAAIAAVHAGWRGTAAGVARRAVSELERAGIRPARLVAAIGPAVGPCCYEVSDEVAGRVARAAGVPPATLTRPGPRSRPLLDLPRAVRAQLVEAGLPEEGVSTAPWCTACRADLFYSYRRDPEAGGRMTALIGWRESETGPA